MTGLLTAALAGAVCGVLSGFGVGGGSVLMLYLTAVAGLDQRTAQGVNLLYFLPTALAAVVFHAKHGLVDRRAAVPAMVAGCLTALGCSYLAMSLDLALLKKLFGVFLLATGGVELLHK